MCTRSTKEKNVGDRTGGAQQQERDTRHKKLGGRSKGTTAIEKCAVKSTTYEREILHQSTVMKNVRYAQHRSGAALQFRVEKPITHARVKGYNVSQGNECCRTEGEAVQTPTRDIEQHYKACLLYTSPRPRDS